MKRWMTSLAPNRRTKFVSFTSRLLGKWSGGQGAPAGRGSQGRGGIRSLHPPEGLGFQASVPEARVASGKLLGLPEGPLYKCQLSSR